ncbi:MAG: O-antigen ligase family protein [Candidatus Electrothrix sp. GW3-4]|uniref:O-antigen ligase family protein n=1 Tax=Candidatus Electrothrix sp. GW3-4 TaxID=3126740 RepID=UPI0030D27F64
MNPTPEQKSPLSRSFRDRVGQINSLLPALLAFAVPLSTSAVSVLAILILLLWLLEGRFIEKGLEIVSHPVAVAVFSFLALLCLGLLWTDDLVAGLEALKDQWKLALLPVILTAAAYRYRALYLYAFLGGMTLAMGMTFLARFGLVQYADVSPTHLTPKTFHVIYNPLLAFAIYLLFHEAIWGLARRNPAARLLLFSLAALMTVNMFITEGRTGQAVFLVLMGLLLFQIFAQNRLKATLAILLLLPSISIIGYLYSPTFQQRVNLARQEIEGFQKNPDTSVGMRLLFFQNSLEIIRHHPWFGVGTGDFQSAYAEVNSTRSPASIATDNPHNQYVLVGAMLGGAGLLLFLLIFIIMFVLAKLLPDPFQRLRIALPLFFLVIMLAESYLTVYQTAFFFVVMAAALFKEKPDQRLQEVLAENASPRCWLILSYRANIPGSACSQHIDDRLPFFRDQGIEPILLSGPVGNPSDKWIHFRTLSLAPSGIRFELRHFLRKHLQKRWQFKLVESICMIPIFPFYLLEKILINMESEWSWCFLASLRGFLLCRQLRPEVVYSTGGSASAHVAGLLIKRWTGCTWIAETQDPLVHDHGWRRGKRVLRVYKALEKKIGQHADAFVFLVQAAMRHCRRRTGGQCRGAVVYPGSIPELFQQHFCKKERCHFAHFGSLAGTRNLVTFFQALHQVLNRYKERAGFREKVQVDVYGSFDGASEREMERLGLTDLVVRHGIVSRQQALVAMQQTDCLLVIQNIIYFSCETIPSKVYEYLLTGRPIIGLVYNNEELDSMLTEHGHLAVPANNVQAIAGALDKILDDFVQEEQNATLQTMPARDFSKLPTVADAVQKLIALAEDQVEDQVETCC